MAKKIGRGVPPPQIYKHGGQVKKTKPKTKCK